MINLHNYIDSINKKNEKALSLFLTSGFPDKNKFIDTATSIFNADADILELGIPFSDPLADGPTIQLSSQIALQNNTTIDDTLHFAKKIYANTNKPIVLMGYANPILKYGVKRFIENAEANNAAGVIIPDLPLEERELFFENIKTNLSVILLTTPTSPEERIKKIDNLSSGFVYCVSVTGTTGSHNKFTDETKANLQRTYKLITKNKMLIGFGISEPKDIIEFKNFAHGFIVGSAIIKEFLKDSYNINTITDKVRLLKEACRL